MSDGLEENAEQILREIDDALARIEDGSYGTCTVCGEEIPRERLEAVPYATLCVADKRRWSAGERAGTGGAAARPRYPYRLDAERARSDLERRAVTRGASRGTGCPSSQ